MMEVRDEKIFVLAIRPQFHLLILASLGIYQTRQKLHGPRNRKRERYFRLDLSALRKATN
jgi:hypothetical protein